MDKIWMKEKIHKFFLLIQSRPFIVVILLIVVMSTILRIITPCLLVLCSLATATCVAYIGTGEFLGFASRTGEFQAGLHGSKESSASLCMHALPNCTHALNTQVPPSTSWKFRFVQSLRQVSRSSLVFVKTHVLSDLREEGLYVGGVEDDMLSVATERMIIDNSRLSKIQGGGIDNSRLSKIQGGGKNGWRDDADVCENGESICAHGSLDTIIADGKVQASCVNHLHDEVEVGDVPELEDCTTSSEEEEVCKSVLETTTHASDPMNDIVVADAMLQPMNVPQAALVCPSEDEHSIEKHQILPLEGCKQCKNICCKDVDDGAFSHGCTCYSYRDRIKLEITDAELQKAASEFYTLEGDVLWSETDVKKQQSRHAGASVVPTMCDFCKQEGKLSISSQTFSFFPSKARTGRKTYTHLPASSKVVYYVNAKRAEEGSESEESVCTSAEESNNDVMIDQELRAIACRSGNKGEESNYMSTAGSFRDYVGSFREFDTFWPDYDLTERKEGEFRLGCCDDHAKPCISHSRSRSKVLQTDPLLSKASLIREQEVMDVLWQEYNEDMRQKHNNLGKQQMTQKQKQPKLGEESSSGSSISEVLNEGSTAESFNVLQSDYVMKLNGMPNRSADERHDANSSCRFGCDKPCWDKPRGYQRRRHFIGFCKLFRELGLKQCMQSSKVDK